MSPTRRALAVLVPLTVVVAAAGVVVTTAESHDPPHAAGPVGWHPPRLQAPTEVRAVVGDAVSVEASAFDAAGNELDISVSALPDDATSSAPGVIRWGPDDAGSTSVTMVARDGFGLETTSEVTLLGRYPAHDGLLVGMGDSVASGHGLQRRDYLGRDGCWRDQESAYPRRVLDGLVDAGRLGADAELALVACSGADTDDLLERTVTGGPDDLGDEPMSQIEWAVRSNPEVVTVTVGANDLDFHRPSELIDGDGLDVAHLDVRLDVLAEQLEPVLARLLDATDATVVVTNYHNPVADEPKGVDGCRDRCFREAVDEASGRLNGRLADAVESLGTSRVVLADVASAFDGHGAPRPAGGFTLREAGLGALARVAPVPEITTSAYCADGDGDGGGSWVSGVDCVHPDGSGAAAYAEAVLAALGV